MKIYLATKFENRDYYHHVKRLLERAGHCITFDWTAHNVDESSMANEQKRRFYQTCAYDDFFGVSSCDAMVLLAYPKMAGAFAELGIALALNKRVIVLNEHEGPRNIFYYLPNVTHIHFEEQIVPALSDDYGCHMEVPLDKIERRT